MAVRIRSTLLSFAVLVCLQLVLQVSAQVVVDNERCREFSHVCGQPNGPTSQKYCCAEGNGGRPHYSCCNPYTGLYIGIGVSVPIIVILLVLCCVLYVVYARYRRKKLQALLRNYSRRRHQQENANTNSFVAPPPYTPIAGEGETQMNEPGLPAYSEVDISSNSAPSQREPTAAEQDTANESTTAQNGAETETTEIPLEDVPLLSDDDEDRS